MALTKDQGEELCRVGGIPRDRRDRFIQLVEQVIADYLHQRERKSALAVEAELAQITRRVARALHLLDRRTWRPGEFHRILGGISISLRNLSPAAREYCTLRNLKFQHDLGSNDLDVLIDPICFTERDDRVLALRNLFGAFAGPVARREGPGRRPKDLERALYHFLAAAYSRETGRAASDTSTEFLAMCKAIKQLYRLDDWRPDSMARLARRPRTCNR